MLMRALRRSSVDFCDSVRSSTNFGHSHQSRRQGSLGLAQALVGFPLLLVSFEEHLDIGLELGLVLHDKVYGSLQFSRCHRLVLRMPF